MGKIFSIAYRGKVAVKASNVDTAKRLTADTLPFCTDSIYPVTHAYLTKQLWDFALNERKQILAKEREERKQLRAEGRIKVFFAGFLMDEGTAEEQLEAQTVKEITDAFTSGDNKSTFRILEIAAQVTPREIEFPESFETDHFIFDSRSDDSEWYTIIRKADLVILGKIIYREDDIFAFFQEPAKRVKNEQICFTLPELKELYDFMAVKLEKLKNIFALIREKNKNKPKSKFISIHLEVAVKADTPEEAEKKAKTKLPSYINLQDEEFMVQTLEDIEGSHEEFGNKDLVEGAKSRYFKFRKQGRFEVMLFPSIECTGKTDEQIEQMKKQIEEDIRKLLDSDDKLLRLELGCYETTGD